MNVINHNFLVAPSFLLCIYYIPNVKWKLSAPSKGNKRNKPKFPFIFYLNHFPNYSMKKYTPENQRYYLINISALFCKYSPYLRYSSAKTCWMFSRARPIGPAKHRVKPREFGRARSMSLRFQEKRRDVLLAKEKRRLPWRPDAAWWRTPGDRAAVRNKVEWTGTNTSRCLG